MILSHPEPVWTIFEQIKLQNIILIVKYATKMPKLVTFWALSALYFEEIFPCRPMFFPIKSVRKGLRDYINSRKNIITCVIIFGMRDYKWGGLHTIQ